MEQIIPLNRTVLDHLQAIRGDREKVFDFGGEMDRYFYTYLHWLQDQCGIPRAEHFGLHALRRTCASRLWASAPAAAQLMLGHTSRDTTQQFYVQGRDILASAVEQMPQPAAFNGKGAT
jgi:integrase